MTTHEPRSAGSSQSLGRRALRPARRLAARFSAPDAVGLPAPGSVRTGARPRRVKLVQRMVNDIGFATVAVDGAYGPATDAAVRELQRRLRLPVTGVADPLTVAAGLVRAERKRRERQRVAVPARPPEPRRVILALPEPPQSGDRRPTLSHMVLEAAPHQYLPRKLAGSGIKNFEPESTSCFLALLEALDEAGTVFDVGANIGVYSYLAQAVAGRDVIAFEPVPDLAATVRRSAQATGLTIPVEERALGRNPGVATFFLSDTSDLSNSLNPTFRDSSRQLVVPVDTLDGYLERTGRAPVVLKVDAESTDADVLGGAQLMIEAHRPWILVEVLDDRGGADIQAEVEGKGYSFHPLRSDVRDLDPQDTIVGRSDGKPWNWLLAPEPLPAGFAERVARWREAMSRCGPVRPDGDPPAGAA